MFRPVFYRRKGVRGKQMKIAGAGGGGFLLLYCPKAKQARAEEKLGRCQRLEFYFYWVGARIVFAQ